MEENKALQIFSYEGNEIRIVEPNGETWWVAKDICKVLDIQDAKQAIDRLDEDERGRYIIPTPGGPQEMLCVNEPGLYSLILTSRKAEAKAFKRWVTHEVLPAIRKTGSYSQTHPLQGELADVIADPERLAQFIYHLQGVQASLYGDSAVSNGSTAARKLATPGQRCKLTKESREVLAVLHRQGKPMYPRELAAFLDKPRGTIRVRLFTMKRRGEVKETDDGYISLILWTEPE